MSNYWGQRYLDVKRASERSAIMFEADTLKRLDTVNAQLDRVMADWYKRYAKTNGMPFDDAARILKRAHQTTWTMTLAEFERKAKAGGYDDELDSAYIEDRVRRLQLLQQQLATIVEPVVPELSESLSKALGANYEAAYNHVKYNDSALTGAEPSYTNFNEQELKAVVSKPWANGNFSKSLWGNFRDKLPEMLTSKLAEGVVLGYGTKKMAHHLALTHKQFNEQDLHRLLHTEMAHISEVATFQGYQEDGIEQYQYLATLESHTCPVCRVLDGKTFKVSEQMEGINYPPIHPYCRCTTMAVIDGMPDHGKRWSKDPVTGKSELVDDVSYGDWLKRVGSKAGGVYGALNDGNDPYFTERDRAAGIAYKALANAKRKPLEARISERSGVDEPTVSLALTHVLDSKYDLRKNGKEIHFDPDYDMAQSLQRLRSKSGPVFKHDIVLLHHEAVEAALMDNEGLDYDTAHLQANSLYNYSEELSKWKGGQPK